MTTVPASAIPDADSTTARTFDSASALAATAYAVVFASACIVIGLIWDISWHRTIGRDMLLTPAHLSMYIGATVAGLSCGWLVLSTTFRGTDADRSAMVRFWGFRGPIGAWVCIWGTFAVIISAPFDDWWHNAYGLDVKVISPPHILLALGMLTIQMGALLMLASRQDDARLGTRARLLYAVTAGILLEMMMQLLIEYRMPNDQHSARFYQVVVPVTAFFLFGTARGARLRWPATTIALGAMAIDLAMNWILPLFPATPMLAPIYNPVTHMVPFSFPVLLVVPGLLIDLLMARMGTGRDTLLAVAGAVALVAVVALVQWPMASFLVESPLARNWFFLGDRVWAYSNRLGDWRYEFWGTETDAAGNWSAVKFGTGLGIAVLITAVMSRLSLGWGNWIARVRR